MRKARAGFLLVALVAASMTPLCSGLAFAQQLPTQAVASQPASEADAPQSAQDPADQAAANCPGHPDALGTSRVLAIDPAQYPRIGSMQYRDSLPLNDKEVVLTLDDGPILPCSNQILDILASQCVKATISWSVKWPAPFPPRCAAFTRKDTRSGRTVSIIRPGSANCRSRECVTRSTGAFLTSAPHSAIPNISPRSSVFPVWRDPVSSKANSPRASCRYSHPTPTRTTGITASVANRSLPWRCGDWKREAKEFCFFTTSIRRPSPRCPGSSRSSRTKVSTLCEWLQPRPT